MHERTLALCVLVLASALLVACTAPVEGISGDELSVRIAAGDAPVVLDVRSREEYAAGHIPGAVNIPYDELAERLGEVPAGPGDEVVVHCQRGPRAHAAEKVLVEAGYTNVRNLEGHMADWRSAGRPVE